MTKAFKAGLWTMAAAGLLAAPVGAQQDSAAAGTHSPAGTTASAPGSKPEHTAPLTAAEKKFMADSAQTNMLEIKLGQLALQKSASNDVKSFARRMVQDHTQAQDALQKVADQSGVKLPSDLDEKGKKEWDKLNALNGKSFDVAYMSFNVPAHRQTMEKMRHAEAQLKDPALKSWDKQTLPVVEQHVKLAEQTDRAVASQKSGTKTGGASSHY